MKELIKSMISIQKELQSIKKDSKGQAGNRVFSYANLESIWEALQPLLVKNGVWLYQTVVTIEGAPWLESTVYHESGQSLSSKIKMDFIGTEIKAFGGAISYYRRYAIQSIFSIICSDDPKDEGDKDPEKMKDSIKKSQAEPKLLEPEQIREINTLLESLPSEEVEKFLERMKAAGFANVGKLPQARFNGTIKIIHDILRLHEVKNG